MIEIDGKHYKLEEAWVFDEAVISNRSDVRAYGYGAGHYVAVNQPSVKVKKAFVLVEVEDE